MGTLVNMVTNRLQEEIKPHTKGAPRRRALAERIERAHMLHMVNLNSGRGRSLARARKFYTDKFGTRHEIGITRHNPSCQRRIEQARRNRIDDRIDALINNSPAPDAVRLRWCNLFSVEIPADLLFLASGLSLRDYLKLDRDQEQATARWGEWTITTTQRVAVDYNYYAKSYGHPKITVSGRTITFVNRRTGLTRATHLANFSGDFIARGIRETGISRPEKKRRKITLNPAYTSVWIEKNPNIYERRLLGVLVDYAIEGADGTVYHDKNRENLERGLKLKQMKKGNKAEGWIDWDYCRSLGFCEAGLGSFCDDFGLNRRSAYPLDEIRAKVYADIHLAAPYFLELQQLGIINV